MPRDLVSQEVAVGGVVNIRTDPGVIDALMFLLINMGLSDTLYFIKAH